MDYVLSEPAEAVLLLVYTAVMYFTARMKVTAHNVLTEGSGWRKGDPSLEATGVAFPRLCIAGFLASKMALPGIDDFSDPEVVSLPALVVSCVMVADMVFMLLPHDRLWPWNQLLPPKHAARLSEAKEQQRQREALEESSIGGHKPYVDELDRRQRCLDKETEASRPPTEEEVREYRDFMAGCAEATRKGIHVHYRNDFLRRMYAIRDRMEWAGLEL